MKSTGPRRKRFGGDAVIAVMNGWSRPMQGYDGGVAVPYAGGKGGKAGK